MISKVCKEIVKAKNIILFTHILPDGDTVGSAVSLCHAVRKLGKKCYILPGEEIPDYLKFLDSGDLFILDESKIKELIKTGEYDTAISIDSSDLGRLEERAVIFNSFENTINIDHHITNDNYAKLNLVDANVSATGEIIFRVLTELLNPLGFKIDKEIAEGMYTAITTDTGKFQYSNTTSDTHKIVAMLIETGMDLYKINLELYQNVRLEQMMVQKEILNNMEMYCDGKVAFSYIDQEALKRIGASIDETDGMSEMLRNIDTVEVSIFAKELEKGKIKVGFRSKRYFDVSKLAQTYGGGGHAKAAGCTIFGTMDDVKALVKDVSKMELR